jgi:hypothetical protein
LIKIDREGSLWKLSNFLFDFSTIRIGLIFQFLLVE